MAKKTYGLPEEASRQKIAAPRLDYEPPKPRRYNPAIALIGCHRGLNSKAGAEGVGQAATEAFVTSFIVILAIDFFLAMFLNNIHEYLWPMAGAKMI